MTSRERLDAVIARQRPDRVPWSPMLGDSYLRSRPEYFDRLTPDQRSALQQAYRYPSITPAPSMVDFERELVRTMVSAAGGDVLEGVTTVHAADPGVTVEAEPAGPGTLLKIHTPWGDLTEISGSGSSAETVFMTKHAIQERADYDVFARMLETRQFSSDTEEWRRSQASLGDAGTCYVNGPDLPLVTLFRVRDPAQVLLDLADEPRRMEEILQLLHARALDAWQCVAEGPGVMVMTGAAFLTTQLISPRIFARYVQPHLTAYAGLLHARGKVLVCHMCGFVKRLLPMLAESMVDGLDSLTNPPLGDATLVEFWRVIGDRAILKSGVNPVLLRYSTVDEIRAHTRETLRQCEGHPLILSTADEVPHGTPPENLRAVAECAV